MSLRSAPWFWIGALCFVVLEMVLSPLRAVAATVPVLFAYDAAVRPTTTTAFGRNDAVRPEAERPAFNDYDCDAAALYGYDASSNRPWIACAGAVHAYGDALEHANRGEADGEGVIYKRPFATTAAEGGGAAITRGEQVTEEVIRNAMKDAPLSSQQAGGVSLPRVQQYVDKLLAGEVPPAIKVDGSMIVDGNHRYIAGQILGRETPVIQWLGGRPGSAVPWGDIPISPEAW